MSYSSNNNELNSNNNNNNNIINSNNNHSNNHLKCNAMSTTTTTTTALPSHSSSLLSLLSVPKLLSHVKLEHLIAGISGGVVSALVLHPLDLLQVRLAVNDGQVAARPQYHGLANAVKTIVKQDGFKGLYRGVAPNCFGAGMSWGFYFLFYNTIKARMLDGNSSALGPGRHILAAAEAGVLTLTITNPIWVVKTRLCLQYGDISELNIPTSKRYKGMVDALRKVYKYEGFPGLYKGYIPGILGVSHGALQFMAYEELKKWYTKEKKLEPDAKLNTFAYLSCAALSKLFAASITYPYLVVRARLQDQHNNYSGVIDVIKKTWRNERLRGFYKGIPAYLIHVTPNICIVFFIYETFSPSSAHLTIIRRPLNELVEQ